MPRPRSAVILTVLGVLILIAAAALRFYVVPSVSKLPNSLDVTNRYEGTGTLLNPAALASGDTAHAVASGVPVTLDRHTFVSNHDGETAIVHDDFTVHAPGGISLPTNHVYAVDRKSMDAAAAPADTQVEAHHGMTIGLPMHPDPDAGYQLYDFATGSTVPMNFSGASTISDRKVQNYSIHAAGALRDPAILAGLPASLPKAQLASLAPLLPADLRTKIGAAAPAMPDPVPLTYTADSKIGLSIDNSLGTPVDGTLAMQVVANVGIAGEPVAVMPVMALDTKLTPTSVSKAASSAASASRMLTIASVVAPLVLLVLGVILLGLGVRRWTRSQSTLPPIQGTESSRASSAAH